MAHLVSYMTRRPLALLAAGTTLLAACGDATTEPHEEDHADEVEGVVLVVGTQTVASYDHEDGEWTGGELEVAAGEQTAYIEIRFVDHDGETVELDEDFYLEVDITDGSIAAFEQDTPGEFGGRVRGVAQGETGAVFELAHGAVGTGHGDFITAPLGVRVTP